MELFVRQPQPAGYGRGARHAAGGSILVLRRHQCRRGAATWTYDAFGNRLTETWTSGGNTTATMPNLSSAGYTPASNQAVLSNGQTFTYDAAGNVTGTEPIRISTTPRAGCARWTRDRTGQPEPRGVRLHLRCGGDPRGESSAIVLELQLLDQRVFPGERRMDGHQLGAGAGGRAGDRVRGERRGQQLGAQQRLRRGRAAGHVPRHGHLFCAQRLAGDEAGGNQRGRMLQLVYQPAVSATD